MQVNIKAEVKQATRYLTSVQKKQIPFATSKTLNQVAYHIAKNKKNPLSMPQAVDETFAGGATPFTKRGFLFEQSNKKNLTAWIYLKDLQDSYMTFQVYGGTRFPKKKALLIPTTHSKLNKYGNFTKGTREKLFSDKKKFFTGVPKGFNNNTQLAGVWERYGSKSKSGGQKIRMVAKFKDSASYKPLFPFAEVAGKVVFSTGRFGFKVNFQKNLEYALKTAR